MVELKHNRIGLQIGLTRHETRCEALLRHPRDNSTHALNGHVVVVATVLDEVFLRQVGLPAVHQVDLLQLGH